MKFFRHKLIYATLFFFVSEYYAQMMSCGSNVPFYQVNLIGQPSGTWFSPPHIRNGNCCNTQSPDRCTSFEILLDSSAAMINFNIADGAIPTGSMYYQINCGPPIPVGQAICVTGQGPHHLTFCKPGNNQNTYLVQSIPKPFIPSPQYVRLGCSKKIKVIGLDSLTVTWNSIYPGVSGQYNYYMNCTSSCAEANYSPSLNAPPYVDFQVCGVPIATACGYVAMCDTVRIYNVDPISASYSPNPAFFCTGSSGITLNAAASGGYGTYSYLWRDQNNFILSTGSQFQATQSGNYKLEIKDALYNEQSCPGTLLNVPVIQVSIPTVDAGQDQLICYNNNGIQLSGSVNNATGGIWSGGNGVFIPDNQTLNALYIPTITEISSGNLVLTLSSFGSSNSCINSFDQTTIHFATPIQIEFINDSLDCFGQTVTLQANVSGGISPYQYLWNTGSLTGYTNAQQGQYLLSVTDSMGCVNEKSINVFAPLPLNLNSQIIPVSCYNGQNGSIDITVQGGTMPYVYQWSNGIVNDDIFNLAAGDYLIHVVDKNGCELFDTLFVSQPNPLSSITQYSNVSCFGKNDGTLTAIGFGGHAPYSYQWSNGQGGSILNSVSPGNYFVTITDANGCVYHDSNYVQINEPPKLQIINYIVNCPVPGSGLAEIILNINGGANQFYQVSSDSGLTFMPVGQTNFFLPVDSVYFISAKDNSGCMTEIPTLVIVHPQVEINQIQLPNCFYDSDSLAKVSVFVSGGALGIYSITFSNGNVFNIQSYDSIYLPIGSSYDFVVSDSKGCSTIPFSLIINDKLQVNSVLGSFNGYSVSCHGFSNGSIDLTPLGGKFPYQFNWSNGAFTEDLYNLTAGSYSVVVTDNNMCKDTLEFTLDSPTALSMDSVVLSNYNGYNISCNGLNDGEINLVIQGGVAPYSFQWNNGSVSLFQNNLSSGDYTLLVSDNNNCMKNFTVQILEPPPLNLFVSSISDYHGYQISCNGFDDGFVQIMTNGGTGSYNYYCNNLFMGSFMDSVSSGQYNWKVIDGNGCVDSLVLNMSEPNALTFSSVTFSDFNNYQISCSNLNDGVINIEVVGGVGQSYDYVWSNGINSQDQFGLNAGFYSLHVIDSNGCNLDSIFVLNEPPSLSVSGYVSTDYNGFSVSCYGSTDGSIELNISGGVGVYEFGWSNGSLSEDISSVGAGDYSVVVNDLNGCSDTLNFYLSQPDSISIIENVKNVFCNGLSDGSISLNIFGGVPPFYYNWSNGSNLIGLQNLYAGQYDVVVSDINNCTQFKSINVQENNPLKVSATIENVKCFGDSSGIIQIGVSGGTTPYKFIWSNGSNQQNLDTLREGLYVLTLVDANDCILNDTFIISQPESLSIALEATTYLNGHNLSAYNSNDGMVNATISGGVAPFSFIWSNGSFIQNQNHLASGNYTLQLTDFNGCTKTANITLDNPNQLEMPTGFSPNSDDKNDRFMIKGIESYKNNRLYVFNRWGNLVFEKQNYFNEWVGTTNNGDQLPDGTYFVILEIQTPEFKLNGYVDIRR